MRFLVIVVTLICVSSLPAFSTTNSDFDVFIKSREVVATLYFQSNDENLSNNERQHLFDALDKIRKLQKNGRMIRVEGFSSRGGDQERNFHLSFFRARSVADLIEGKGLPAEVALTGYGDMRAGSDDPGIDCRVEIASYLKPVVIKKTKVVKEKNPAERRPGPSVTIITPQNQEIDSYRVGQAISRKIADKNRVDVDKFEMIDQKSVPGLSKTNDKVDDADLDRGYSQWRKSVDPDFSPKVSQSKAVDDNGLKRGYSQWQKNVAAENSPGVTQVMPVEAPVIDALMIEQAIMEKIGTEFVASGTITQVNLNY